MTSYWYVPTPPITAILMSPDVDASLR
jgi:hypothetical protein